MKYVRKGIMKILAYIQKCLRRKKNKRKLLYPELSILIRMATGG